MRTAAGKCNEPQVYDAEEQQTLDAELVLHEMPAKKLKKYKTGTKMYSCDVADTGHGIYVRVNAEIRAPAEQVRYLGLQLRSSTNKRAPSPAPLRR